MDLSAFKRRAGVIRRIQLRENMGRVEWWGSAEIVTRSQAGELVMRGSH